MFRLFAFLFVAVLVTVAAVWIAEQSGDVRLVWRGYLIESTVSVFFGIVVLIVISATLIFKLTQSILGFPSALMKSRKERAEARGYKALMRGMVAVAAGDVSAAKVQSKRAESLNIAKPLRLLLAAQCAQLAGDERAAADSFRAMLSEPESEFLGLRGLFVQALRRGKVDTALGLARRAYKINPKSDWVLKNLIELETTTENWSAAEKSLRTAERRRVIDSNHAQKRRALILYQRAQLAFEENDRKRARNMVLRAVRLRPDFIPAVKLAAKLLVSDRKLKKAKSLVKRGWELLRHPDLANLYVEISKPSTPIERLKILDTLVSSFSNDPEALLVTAEAALDASLWGTVRERLGRALDGDPDQRIYRLMARLEQLEHENEGGARQWLLQATEAKEQPQWNCQVCGTPSLEWVVQCSSCESIDSLKWILLGQETKNVSLGAGVGPVSLRF